MLDTKVRRTNAEINIDDYTLSDEYVAVMNSMGFAQLNKKNNNDKENNNNGI